MKARLLPAALALLCVIAPVLRASASDARWRQTLACRAGFLPVTIDAALPGAIEQLIGSHLSAVVLDLGAANPDPVVALWRARPELMLIGVDLGPDRMSILSGQPARALTVPN